MILIKKLLLWFYAKFCIDIIACMPTILGDKLRWFYIKIFAKSLGKNFIAHNGCYFFYPKKLFIGNNVSFSANSIINSSSDLIIKDNVMVGPNCHITTANHGFFRKDIPMNQQDSVTNKLTINEDVWIGNGVVINSGSREVEIAKGVIIAANSVVTKSIGVPYSIWGGVPAKFIKNR
ncbi:maltose O-acyltransferase (MAT)-like acetyltransferase [Campylobacter iguaniorum]|uniref:acyltransferase n=1 Tax=Campylobacter iguaniorum TaxID=1244531 RepID=UPI00073A4DFA|nr:acyltransferase [Campylobacter iguaniorum]ALV23653.1 maltose O-acyltransferase (MAT)-like acetyltransferase [Campylobacter iguaniorum]